MRFRSASAALAVLLTAASVTGCSSGTRTVSEVEPTTASVTPDSIVFEWQKAYENKINEFKNSSDYISGLGGSMFDLYDITGDGSPELIISPSTDAESNCIIYTFYGGTVKNVGECGVKGVFEYSPENDNIRKKYIGKSFEITEFISVEDTELVTKGKFYNNRNALSSGATLTYEVDNETVNVTEYDRKLAEFESGSYLELGRKYNISSAAVDYALHYSESWGAVLNDIQKDIYRDILTKQIGTAESGAAFEICDLNGDNVPELIISEGFFDSAQCHIYKLGDNVSEDLGEFMTDRGCILFDVEKKVIFGLDTAAIQPQSIDTGEVSGFVRSDNVMECGRKYLLNEDSLNKAFR